MSQKTLLNPSQAETLAFVWCFFGWKGSSWASVLAAIIIIPTRSKTGASLFAWAAITTYPLPDLSVPGITLAPGARESVQSF